jgi:very-short-patch-repair endonuclease
MVKNEIMPKQFTKEIVLSKLKNLHLDKYDYSMLEFKNTNSKVKIICKKHGVFEQKLIKHLNGQGCPKCYNRNKTVNDVKNHFSIKHNGKYDYSLFVEYINRNQKIDIICPEHGIFSQKVGNHLDGKSCPKCSKVYRPSTEDFIKKCKDINEDLYDYSLVEYVNCKTNIKIICREHGIFEQTPSNHLKGQNCPFCAGNKMSTEYFIKKSKEVHNNKYNYEKSIFIDAKTKVIITCPEHGDFEQSHHSHLIGFGCSICSGMKKLTNEEFIKRSKNINGDKYDYSLVDYFNGKSKIKLICLIHGVFEQSPSLHISHKQGCPKCAGRHKTTEDFIKLSKEINGDKYNYDKTIFINFNTKVIITCKKHGDFEQTPAHHLNGQSCPICNLSKGENKIKQFLEKFNIKFNRQKTFDGCEYKKKLQFDFYLPDYNICIEYDGIQHFKPIDFFGGEKSFSECKEKDNMKTDYCAENNISLIRIPYYDNVDNYMNLIKNYKNYKKK